MAERLRQPEGPGRDRWPRAWVSYERYRFVHEGNLAALIAEGVVTGDDTRFTEALEPDGRRVYLRGAITTASGGVLHVYKRLDVRTLHGRPQVLTALYNYHALVWREDGATVDLLRYDNSHGDTGTLHRHVFDDAGRTLREEPIALEELPPLSEVVREVEAHVRRWRERGGA